MSNRARAGTVMVHGFFLVSLFFSQIAQAQQLCLNVRVSFPVWGTGPATDVNGHPSMDSACGTPAEYDCPLFENRPHEELNQSIEALMSALTVTPECKELGSMNTVVNTNANQLRSALQVLRGSFDTTGATTPIDPSETQRNLSLAVESAKALGDVFSSSPFLNSHCAENLHKGGGFVLALTDLLNGLTPFALMGAAVNPGLGMAARLALTGGSLAASAVSSTLAMVDRGNLDMNSPLVRRAVLKNTCLFTKIARKSTFMQLAQSSAIASLSEDLNADENQYRMRYADTGENLKKEVKYREGVEQQAVAVEAQLRRDRFELSSLSADFERLEKDEISLCTEAQELVDQSAASSETGVTTMDSHLVFPTSLVANLNQAVNILRGAAGFTASLGYSGSSMSSYGTGSTSSFPDFSSTIPNPWEPPTNSTPSPIVTNPPASSSPATATAEDPITAQQATDMAKLKESNHRSRALLSALSDRTQKADEKAIHYCAKVAKSWLKTLWAIHTLTGQITNSERATIDEQMSKDPEYAAWKKDADDLRAKRVSYSRFAKVMQITREDNSLIDRTDLTQNMDLLRNALFGHAGGWSMNHSPIEQWLDHVLALHSRSIGSFNENVRDLQLTARNLVTGSKVDPRAVRVPSLIVANEQLSPNLQEITLDRVALGSRGHTLLCQRLQTTWLDWTAAIDYLGAAQFMCQMIKPYIDNKVEPSLVTTCVGNERVEAPDTNSRLRRAFVNLSAPRAGTASEKDLAQIILQKLRDMQCPLPPVTVLNEH